MNCLVAMVLCCLWLILPPPVSRTLSPQPVGRASDVIIVCYMEARSLTIPSLRSVQVLGTPVDPLYFGFTVISGLENVVSLSLHIMQEKQEVRVYPLLRLYKVVDFNWGLLKLFQFYLL